MSLPIEMPPGLFIDKRCLPLLGISGMQIQRRKILHWLDQQKKKKVFVLPNGSKYGRNEMYASGRSSNCRIIWGSSLAIFSKAEGPCPLFQEFQEFPEFPFQLCESAGLGWMETQSPAMGLSGLGSSFINRSRQFSIYRNSAESFHMPPPAQFPYFNMFYQYSTFVIINKIILTHCY